MRNAKVIAAPRPDFWAQALLAGSILIAMTALGLFAFV